MIRCPLQSHFKNANTPQYKTFGYAVGGAVVHTKTDNKVLQTKAPVA